MRRMWTLVLVLATGCGDIELDRLVKQHPPLTWLEPEPVGPHCAHGGHAVHTGLDLNGDGVLDGDEVTATTYACATATPGVLVHLQALPPGGPCPLGGHLSRAGQDLNGNEVLEDDEVTREVYGCTERSSNPVVHRTTNRPLHIPTAPLGCRWDYTLLEAGLDSNGNGVLDNDEVRAQQPVCVNPAQLVVTYVLEPASATCPEGGTRVQAGADVNGDGVLEEEELLVTTFVCEPLHTLYGPYTVRTSADVAALQRISRIQGSLLVVDAALTELRLPGLAVVDQTLRIESNSLLTLVDLPGLRFVGHDLDISGNVALRKLATGSANAQQLLVGRSLILRNNPLLPSLRGLQMVSPRLSVLLLDNDALEFELDEDGPLASIDFLMGALEVTGNKALTALPFANLLHARDVFIKGNPALTDLSGLGALSTLQSLRVVDNASLTRLDLRGLRQVDQSFDVTDNARLPSCLATALAGAVYTGEPGHLVIRGNDDAVTCGE